jgi:hypothetical protein
VRQRAKGEDQDWEIFPIEQGLRKLWDKRGERHKKPMAVLLGKQVDVNKRDPMRREALLEFGHGRAW